MMDPIYFQYTFAALAKSLFYERGRGAYFRATLVGRDYIDRHKIQGDTSEAVIENCIDVLVENNLIEKAIYKKDESDNFFTFAVNGCAHLPVEARLKEELPHWYLEDGWIRRKYKTSGWKATLMVVNAVGHLAEAAFHHPDLTVSYAFVIVKLKNHAAKGITNKDFALARKIEEVIHWQPAREDSPLEGTPDDPRFKYIKYDSPLGTGGTE